MEGETTTRRMLIATARKGLVNLLAVRTDGKTRGVSAGDPDLAAESLHGLAGHRALDNFGLLHKVRKSLVITIVIAETGVLFKESVARQARGIQGRAHGTKSKRRLPTAPADPIYGDAAHSH